MRDHENTFKGRETYEIYGKAKERRAAQCRSPIPLIFAYTHICVYVHLNPSCKKDPIAFTAKQISVGVHTNPKPQLVLETCRMSSTNEILCARSDDGAFVGLAGTM